MTTDHHHLPSGRDGNRVYSRGRRHSWRQATRGGTGWPSNMVMKNMHRLRPSANKGRGNLSGSPGYLRDSRKPGAIHVRKHSDPRGIDVHHQSRLDVPHLAAPRLPC